MGKILSDNYNIPYFLTLMAYLTHKMLGLRLVLLGAHLGYFILAITGGHEAGIFWNGVFLGINLYHVTRILLGRRTIHFDPATEKIYLQVFTGLSRTVFRDFWNEGHDESYEDAPLLTEGQTLEAMMLLTEGQVVVEKGGGVLNHLGAGRFVAEMGYLTRLPASATIRALGKVSCHAWSFAALDRFSQKSPEVWQVVQGILGREMAHKIAEQNPR